MAKILVTVPCTIVVQGGVKILFILDYHFIDNNPENRNSISFIWYGLFCASVNYIYRRFCGIAKRALKKRWLTQLYYPCSITGQCNAGRWLILSFPEHLPIVCFRWFHEFCSGSDENRSICAVWLWLIGFDSFWDYSTEIYWN